MAKAFSLKGSWVVAACLCIANPANSDSLLETRVDAVAAEWLSSTAAPSVSIAIVQHGALVYSKAHGQARRWPAGAATRTSRYALDSITKEFTAAAILLLAEDGKLSLEDPLRKWFPEIGQAANVTLRQILTHTSGIRDFWPQDFVPPHMRRPTTVADIVKEWVNRPLDFEPGSEWQYSNTGYVLAAAVVERVSGETFFAFLRRRIFEPLQMAHVADQAMPLSAQDADGYTRYGLGPLRRAPKESPGWLFGAANLAMPPSDLALWDLSLMDRTLLHPQSYEAAFAPVVLNNGATAPYGLGLDIEHVQDRLRIGHSGGGSGFLAENRVWPAERAAIVVLTNNDWASPSDLLDRIAFLVLTPAPAQARARAVFAALQNGSIDKAMFTATGNFYFNAVVLADLHSSLSPLGPARLIELESESKRGGMITRRWKILCANARLEAIERGDAGGKLDEFMVAKRAD